MKIEIKKTNDGSDTLFLPEMNETYHSIHGAVQESEHVFLKMGIHTLDKEEINILEIGFGTGLNALLTSQLSDKTIHYHSLEPFPIEESIWKQLNYCEGERADWQPVFDELHQAKWDEKVKINSDFILHKHHTRLEQFESKNSFDIIYFDAFAPNKQAEVWSLENLKKVYNLLNPNGVLVTYCSQGAFKRNLKEAGFEVNCVEGPPGKREMVRAVKR